MIFTFYSYKGGVGRSMALAAVANTFAMRGLRVLAVDFDLEAPGLERYFFDAESSRFQRAQLGLIDLIQAYRRALSNEAEFTKADFKHWDRYKLTAIYSGSSLGGSVDLMTAGAREPEERLREYALMVRSFDWQDFFYNWKGDQFFSWLRDQWSSPGTGYDVVLIDSRTGVTEMGGVCAYQLADAAVLLCAPNYQNLDGTRAVVSDFRSNAVTGLRHGRELQILVVPARVEPDHPQKDEFLAAFERDIPRSEGLPKALADAGLNYRNLSIPYLPEYAIGDRLVGGESSPIPPDETISNIFSKLADALTLLANFDSKLGKQKEDALAHLSGVVSNQAVGLVADTTRSSAGYDVFLDYSQADEIHAFRLRDALEKAGFHVFVNFGGGVAADTLSEEFRTALEYSDVFFFCVGRLPPGEWREAFLMLARRMGHVRIVPVLFEGADPSSLRALLLDDQKALDLRNWSDSELLEDSLRNILTTSKPLSRSYLSETNLRPYQGSMWYNWDDSRFFSGREQEIQQLVDALNTYHVVIMEGAAKVGKTSLVLAGLLPNIGTAHRSPGYLMVHGYRFLDAADLQSLLSDKTANWLFEHGSDFLPSETYPNLLCIDGIDSFLDGPSPNKYEERTQQLVNLLRYAGPDLHILLIGRGTFPDAQKAELQQTLVSRSYIHIQLDPLSKGSLIRAIEEPARRAGHLLEPGLAERLIESAGKARNAIFQIQLALPVLWNERRRGWLTNKALDTAGHVDGLFIRHLETSLSNLNETDRYAVTVFFKTLCRLNSSLKLVSEPQNWEAVSSVPVICRVGAERLRDWLAERGLIDLWHDNLGGHTLSNVRTLKVALVRPNPTQYLGGGETVPDATFLLWRSQFASYVLHWNSVGRSNIALVSGNVLAEAEEWLTERNDELTEAERSTIEASIVGRERREKEAQSREDAEREKERQARRTAEDLLRAEKIKNAALEREQGLIEKLKNRKKLLNRALEGTIIMLILTAGGLYSAVNSYHYSKLKFNEANSLRLSAESLAILQGSIRGGDFRALLQLLAAYRISPENDVVANLFEAQVLRHATRKIIPASTDVTAIAFSPDGTHIVSGGADWMLRLWDARTGQATGAPLQGHDGTVTSLAYSPDGMYIVSGSEDQTLRIWDARTGQTIGAPLRGHGDFVTSVAFSPDGTHIVSGSRDKTLRLWDARAGQPIGEPLTGHANIVTSVAFSPDGTRIISGSMDKTLRLWNGLTGHSIGTPLRGHLDFVTSVVFSPDGTHIVSGSADQILRMWDARTGQAIGTPLWGHEGLVKCVAFSPDGTRFVSGGADQTLRMWDARTGQPIGVPLTGHANLVTSVAFSKDGTSIVSGSNDQTLRLWDARTGQAIGAPLRGHESSVTSVAFSPDGMRIVSGSVDQTLRLWDAQTGTEIGAPLLGHDNTVTSVALSPDGTRLVSGSFDGTLRLWNVRSGQPIGTPLGGHESLVTSVAFSPDGTRIVSGSADQTLRVWDARTGQTIGAPLRGHERFVTSVAYSSDGMYIVSGSDDQTLRLWDARKGQAIGAPLRGHKGTVTSVAFSMDGTRIVSGSWDKTLRLWNVRTREPIGSPLIGHANLVTSVAFSKDGTHIVSGSADKTLRLWNGRTGHAIGTPLRGHLSFVTSVAFSPDGTRIVSGSDDHTLRQWPAPKSSPDELCKKLTRNMSHQEWDEWVSPDMGYVEQCPGLPIPQDEPDNAKGD